jgi:hypothetical protein
MARDWLQVKVPKAETKRENEEHWRERARGPRRGTEAGQSFYALYIQEWRTWRDERFRGCRDQGLGEEVAKTTQVSISGRGTYGTD